jgi:hypothetical protein
VSVDWASSIAISRCDRGAGCTDRRAQRHGREFELLVRRPHPRYHERFEMQRPPVSLTMSAFEIR